MKFSFNCTRISSVIFALVGILAYNQCRGDVTIQIQAVNLQDAGGSPMNGLVVFAASRSNASFTLPSTTNFVSGDDVVLARFDCVDGFLDTAASGLVLTNGWDANDPLAIYWFPTLTTSSPTNAIPAGTPYGVFYDSDSLMTGFGSAPWVTPGDGSYVTIQFVTASQSGPYAETAGLASSVVSSGNTPPVANSDGPFFRAPSLSLKIPIATLLANDTDAETNTITFTGIPGTSTNGVALSTNATYVFYPSNVSNVADRFSYTISDGQGGVSTGLVYIAISPSVVGQAVSITNASGSYIATFAGIPTYSYTVQRATNVNFSGTVTDLVTTNAPAAGLFRWTDSTPPTPTAFYRLRYNSP